jgi:hypothetical protein
MKSRRKNGLSSPEKDPAKGEDVQPVESLQGEIDMLRTLLREVEAMAGEGKTLGELLKMLDILGKSSTRLAGLLRAQRELGGDKEFGSVFNHALSEVIKELGSSQAGQ